SISSLKPTTGFPFSSPQPQKILSATRKCGLPHVMVSLVSGSDRQIFRILVSTVSALAISSLLLAKYRLAPASGRPRETHGGLPVPHAPGSDRALRIGAS